MGNDGNVHKLGQQWTHFVTFGIHPCENSNSFDPYPDWMESQDNSEENEEEEEEEEEVSIGDFELPAREMTVTARNSISYKDKGSK